MAKKIKVDADTFLASPTQYGVQLQGTEYTYQIGDEVVLFDKREEYFGKVDSVTETSVFCTMGDDTPIEYPKGRIIPTDQVKDLFDTPELIPDEVNAVLNTFNENADSYHELDRIVNELEPLGYTFSYYLDADPYWLRKIN
jgi:hypothetical protein